MNEYFEWEQEMKEIDIEKAFAAYREGKKFNERFKKRRPTYQLELFYINEEFKNER